MQFRSVGGGISDATSFSDTLVSPDQPFCYGDQYFCCQYSTGGITANMDGLAAAVNRNVNGLTMTASGGGSQVLKCVGIPRPLSFLQVDGKAQFAQIQIVSDTSGAGNVNTCGIGVFAQTNKSLLYALRKNAGAVLGGVTIVKTVVGVDTNLGATHAVAANDIVRLEVRPQAGGVNQLICKINGVIVETQTDNAIAAGGLPCIDVEALFIGAQVTTWKNFSCGLLTS